MRYFRLTIVICIFSLVSRKNRGTNDVIKIIVSLDKNRSCSIASAATINISVVTLHASSSIASRTVYHSRLRSCLRITSSSVMHGFVSTQDDSTLYIRIFNYLIYIYFCHLSYVVKVSFSYFRNFAQCDKEHKQYSTNPF